MGGKLGVDGGTVGYNTGGGVGRMGVDGGTCGYGGGGSVEEGTLGEGGG